MKRPLMLIIAAGLAACSDVPTQLADIDAVRPSFSSSSGCNGGSAGQSFCDAAREAIDNLLGHENAQCQWLGQQADMRFNDPHSEANSITYDAAGGTFYFYPETDMHQGAPEHTGHSYATSYEVTSHLQGEIASAEAMAYGSGSVDCS